MAEPWWDRMDGALASNERRATRRSIAVNYPPALYPFVLEAAKARGMSMTAFQRRAALSFAQFDLGFDWFTEMAAEPPVGSFVGAAGRGELVHGDGFGRWRILDLAAHARHADA